MLDVLNDEIKKIYIEPTSNCNLNCSMCFRKSWVDEPIGMMDNSTIHRFCEEITRLNSLETVTFAGMGEPLLHKQIVSVIKFVNELGISTEIVTNATLLSPEKIEMLIDSGLKYIWISIDDSHIQNTTKKVLVENIKYLNNMRHNKCKLGLTYVLCNPQTKDLVQIEKQADLLGADMINISQVIPNDKIDGLQYSQNIPIGKMTACDIYTQKTRKLNYCPFVEENCIFIKWNGDIVPCMQLLHSSYTFLYDERRFVKAYSFGNLLKDGLEEIWNSTEYKDFRERVKKFEFPDCTLCDGCDDRKENRTDCMYNTMPTCGACLWAQNIARCP